MRDRQVGVEPEPPALAPQSAPHPLKNEPIPKSLLISAARSAIESAACARRYHLYQYTWLGSRRGRDSEF